MNARKVRYRAAALIFVFAVATGLVLSATAARAADTAITGRVVDATNGGAVPDIEVTLHTFEDGVEAPATSDTTDRNGRFAFSTLVAGAERSFQVSVRFAGVVYRSRVLQPADGETTDLTMKVYETTAEPDDLKLAAWTVWLDEETDGRLAIQHSLTVENDGDAAYVGTEPIDDAFATLTLPLVTGAADFQYLGRFTECCTAVRGTEFAHTLPIEPGTSDATLRYTAPPPGSLSFPLTIPTDDFAILVPTTLAIETTGLTAAGQTQDGGITYRVYSASDLAVGDRIGVTLADDAGGGASMLPRIAIGLGVVLLFGGGALWWLTRARRVPVPAPRAVRRAAARASVRSRGSARAPRSRNGDRDARTKNGNGRRGAAASGRTEVDADESLLIDEIVALDVAHEQGLLDQETYRKLRAAAKDRLLALRDGR